MYLVAGILGLATGFVAWLVASHWIATSITRVEARQPGLVGTRRMRAREAIACGLLFLACVALAAWVVWLVVN